MWLSRVFASAFVRKCAYLVAGFLFALLLGRHAHAQATCYVINACSWSGPTGMGATGTFTSAAACDAAITFPGGVTLGTDGVVDLSTGTVVSNGTAVTACCGSPDGFISYSIGTGSCPASCSDAPGTYDINPPGGTVQSEGSTGCTAGGCTITYGPVSSFRSIIGQGGMKAIQTGVVSSTTCTPVVPTQKGSQVDNGTAVTDCLSGGGGTLCAVQAPSGQYCGSYNGDPICLGGVASGTCTSYSSGGVMCVAAASTAAAAMAASALNGVAPDASGASGVAVSPSAQVCNQSSSGVQCADYYTVAQVAASLSPVRTSGTPTTSGSFPKGSAASGLSTGDCSASGVAAGLCDCSAGPICGDIASGGTDCSSPPTCSGDTVLCNALLQGFLARCPTDTPSSVAASMGLVGSPGSGVGIWSSSVDISSALSGAGATGPFAVGAGTAATCPAPMTVTMFGQTYTLDLTTVFCEFAQAISWAVLLLATFVSSRIMIGAIVPKGV